MDTNVFEKANCIRLFPPHVKGAWADLTDGALAHTVIDVLLRLDTVDSTVDKKRPVHGNFRENFAVNPDSFPDKVYNHTVWLVVETLGYNDLRILQGLNMTDLVVGRHPLQVLYNAGLVFVPGRT